MTDPNTLTDQQLRDAIAHLVAEHDIAVDAEAWKRYWALVAEQMARKQRKAA